MTNHAILIVAPGDHREGASQPLTDEVESDRGGLDLAEGVSEGLLL